MWIVEGVKGDVSALGNLGELRKGSKRIYCGESVGAPHGNDRASLGESIRTVSGV